MACLTQKCEQQLTIAIYCAVKGFIPEGEKEFPKSLGEFKTDIRKGVVFSATLRPNDFHDNIRIGRSISGTVENCFTLGPFFEHPVTKRLCTWSCAHGFVLPDDLATYRIAHLQHHLRDSPVYQPPGHSNGTIGKIIAAEINEGDSIDGGFISGVDGVIIEIDCRPPLDGSFPYDEPKKIDDAGKISFALFVYICIHDKISI